ncbi:hypothetical protein IEQ34_007899 [Dendrobium chrysotoxum]|uniref:Endoglucanase n=1 Tax=Dendrobium chrysotoxum TaxID=161865 RepID=A0AAV7H344_DENCH|nr:hypothetical protein IEQ34_007899 [Dendrobium chrysotoxum]
MLSRNQWGGALEIHDESPENEELDRDLLFSNELSSTMFLAAQNQMRKERYVDLGCIVCKLRFVRTIFLFSLVCFVVVGIPIIVYKSLVRHNQASPPRDEYAIALQKALVFFNAQRSGRLPKNNGIPWRGNSGLQDGATLSDVRGGLVGGYYDGGNNIKFHFPMAFSMTLLSWSVIEYSHKYKAIGEYNHVREIIKWGIDYLLLTFNSSASTINKIYSQVGAAKVGSTSPDDHFCWQRPEDMEYLRPVQIASVAPDLASEMAAALAAASIVFQEEPKYSKKLIHAAKIAYKFAIGSGQQTAYSVENDASVPFYNSSGFWDELIWGAAWMYYATGKYSYLSLATSPTLPNNANAFSQIPYLSVFSWDNKLPGAELLLARLRIVLNPGYPYEEMLRAYHKTVDFNMCSLLQMFKIFKYSKGGLIQLNRRKPQPLPYAVNAAFLATLYADYMNDSNIPGWYCGASYISALTLRKFAASQVKYILGANPMNMSYVVGYGQNFPSHVHHRGASIPSNQRHVSCTGGWKWRDAKTPNPHIITGAMVGGPNQMDQFVDKRQNYNFTEPTIAGNAGLVAALVALTSSSDRGSDMNSILN